ncbi:condensation domain-containing protein, partial [Roseibium sp. RKSG952]|uniref:non-ribosomal peptide synthetase n=1 Tax=Roseibium sp. RKSG952 TaxID=2529384 RepID=UPI0012BC566C
MNKNITSEENPFSALLEKEREHKTIKPRGEDVKIPLSYQQERLWFIAQLDPDSERAYKLNYSIRLDGDLDVAALQYSWSSIIKKHDILRTRFLINEENVPYQYVDKSNYNKIEIINIKDEGIDCSKIIESFFDRKFNLEEGIVIRALLVTFSSSKNIFLFSGHHIVLDGWSIGILVNELCEKYNEFLNNKTSTTVPLSIQYGDYAIWQREIISNESLESGKHWWRSQLIGAPSIINVPTDYRRPKTMSYEGSSVAFEIPTEILLQLRGLAKNQTATLFMVLNAAFVTLLNKIGAGSDIVTGTAVAGRTNVEIEPLIGFFVNTVALRQKIDPRWTFNRLIEETKEIVLESFSHSDIPFEVVVDAVSPDRSLSHAPIIQASLVLQNAHESSTSFTLPNISTSLIETSNKTVKFELGFEFYETSEGLVGRLHYSTRLFERETAERLCRMYSNVITHAARKPNTRIYDLELIDICERKIITEGFNETKIDYPHHKTVVDLFNFQVSRNPESTAILSDEGIITFGELNKRSNQIAHYLIRKGRGSEDVVGVCLNSGYLMVATLLGVLKAGCAYLPIDPSTPFSRLQYMMEDSDANILLTAEDIRINYPKNFDYIYAIDDYKNKLLIDNEQNTDLTEEELLSRITITNLSYIIYTSGSTGQPKGVAVDHSGLNAYLAWASHHYQMKQADYVPITTSISFDATVTSIWLPLVNGACCVPLYSGSDLSSTINYITKNNDKGILKTTPTQMRALSELCSIDISYKPRKIIVGGEELLFEDVQKWTDLASDLQVVNEYGPTETVVGCIVYEACSSSANQGAVPIGTPVWN